MTESPRTDRDIKAGDKIRILGRSGALTGYGTTLKLGFSMQVTAVFRSDKPENGTTVGGNLLTTRGHQSRTGQHRSAVIAGHEGVQWFMILKEDK